MSVLDEISLPLKLRLAQAVTAPLRLLARRCADAWPDANALDAVLRDGIGGIRDCGALCCINADGIAMSSMVGTRHTSAHWRGRDLSVLPNITDKQPLGGIKLSSVYDSAYSHRQCIGAAHSVVRAGRVLGSVEAEFALSDLLTGVELGPPANYWRQFRGDPAVREGLFRQTRIPSRFDENIDEYLATIEHLMRGHGVFRARIHFSSGLCAFGMYDDPYCERLHDVEETTHKDLALAYPARPYPADAAVTPAQIHDALLRFKALRFADENIYLRVGSINLMSGTAGATFSCDGSHYMPIAEFLEKDLSFWVGVATADPQPELQCA
jgi:hypothetical protein